MGSVINFIIGVFQSVFPIVQGVFSAIGNVIGTVVGVIVNIIQTIIGVVCAVFGAIFNVVGSIMNAVGNVISNIFNGIKGAWEGLTNFVSGIFNGIKGFINGVIDNINFAIGIINMIPGVNSGTISHLALGTLNWQGGFAIMNEYGNGESVNLLSGAQVIPHSLSQRMVDTYASNMARMDRGNSGEGNVVVNIAPTSLVLDGREIGQAVYPTVKVKLDRERLLGGV